LLEGQRREVNTPPSKSATAKTEADDRARGPLGRLGSSRVAFAKRKDESSANNEENGLSAQSNTRNADENETDPHLILRSVRGIPEDDPVDAISDRVMLIERRLEAYDEEKSVCDERKYLLPESTFSFLITHPPNSFPFIFAAFSMALSTSCLSLTLASSIQNGSKWNWLGIPAGVGPEVRAAQFLGGFIIFFFNGPNFKAFLLFSYY